MTTTTQDKPLNLNAFVAWWEKEIREAAEACESIDELESDLDDLKALALSDVMGAVEERLSAVLDDVRDGDYFIVYQGGYPVAGFNRFDYDIAERTARILAEKDDTEDIWIDSTDGDTIFELSATPDLDDLYEIDIPDDGT